MELGDILEILGIFASSAIKFSFVGVPAAVYLNYSFAKSLTITISGGCTGAFFFVYASDWIIHKINHFKNKKHANAKPKKKFTHSNKLIIRAKNKFGLLGIAILTPPLISIPVGSFLAVKYFKDKKKILRYMFASICVWGVLLYQFFHLFKK